MNLVDTLAGGIVFCLASVSSLHIYGSSLKFSQGHENRQLHLAAMESTLHEGSQWLWREVDRPGLKPRAGECHLAAADLVTALNQLSVPAGITRVVKQEGEWVSITVDTADFPSRRRWLSPAAFGLCSHSPLHQPPVSYPMSEEESES